MHEDTLLPQSPVSAAGASTLRVRVARRVLEATGIDSFELTAAVDAGLPSFTPGSHIDVRVGDGFVRQYSLCNPSTETHRYVIAVLKEANSRGGSRAIHEKVGVGDLLDISTPRNHFPLANDDLPSLLFAGGIGVTPVLCMAENLQADGREFEMHYCSRSRERAAFVELIARSQFARRVIFHFDDEPAQQWLDLAATLGNGARERHIYVCGPQGFMDAVLGKARELGWPEDHLHYEFFSAAPVDSSGDQPFEVELARSNRVVQVAPQQTVAQALAAAGIDIPLSCEQGVCGTCVVRVLDGIPEHRDVYFTSEEHAANNQITPCCSRARTSRLVLDL